MMHLIVLFLGPGYTNLAANMQKLVDTPQNMMYLSRQMHKYWDEGVFGLEPLRYVSRPKPRPQSDVKASDPAASESSMPATPTTAAGSSKTVRRVASASSSKRKLGSDDSSVPRKISSSAKGKGKETDNEEPEELQYGIEIRFHWLPATSMEHMKVDNPHPLTTDPRTLFVPIPTVYSETFQGDSRPVVTGHIFTIWADKLEDLPSMEFLNLQWLAFKMHRLAGGADPRFYEPPCPDEDDMNVVYAALAMAQERRELEERLTELKDHQQDQERRRVEREIGQLQDRLRAHNLSESTPTRPHSTLSETQRPLAEVPLVAPAQPPETRLKRPSSSDPPPTSSEPPPSSSGSPSKTPDSSAKLGEETRDFSSGGACEYE